MDDKAQLIKKDTSNFKPGEDKEYSKAREKRWAGDAEADWISTPISDPRTIMSKVRGNLVPENSG